jgi:dTDP-L-rhamnose 4-epimerase
MKNNLIIFGGGGFIGTTYYSLFKNNFDRIVIVDWFKEPTHSDPYLRNSIYLELRKNDIIICCDIYEFEKYSKYLNDSNFIYILNADTGTGNSFFNPYDSTNYNSNVLAFLAQKILQSKIDLNSLSIFFASSRAVYGEGYWNCQKHGKQNINRDQYINDNIGPLCNICNSNLILKSFEECQELNPQSVYGLNKYFSEKILTLLFEGRVKKLGIIRFQNVYGVGQSRTNPYTGVLNWFSAKLLNDEKIEIFENGFIRRDFVNVLDVAYSIHMSMIIENNKNYFIYNVGSGQDILLLEVASFLKKVFKSNSEIILTNNFREGDILGAFSSNELIKKDIGFVCGVSLEKGLEDFANWYKSS